MKTNPRLRSAVRLALGLSVGTLAMAAPPTALARQAIDEQIKEITVTGSPIKRADLDTASPATVLDRDAIMARGITDDGNLLQRMPSMSGTPLGTTTNNGNTNEGTVEIDLRGTGPERTITLINGRRTADGGDYTTIPAIMIERVEILEDGADAVAGVVNIISRTDFDGVNVDVQTTDWFDVDAGVQNSISIIAGTTFDRGHFVFGAEYIDQEEAFQADTPWDFYQGSYYIYYEADQGCERDPANLRTFFGSPQIPESRLNCLSQDPDKGVHRQFLVPSPGATMVPHRFGKKCIAGQSTGGDVLRGNSSPCKPASKTPASIPDETWQGHQDDRHREGFSATG